MAARNFSRAPFTAWTFALHNPHTFSQGVAATDCRQCPSLSESLLNPLLAMNLLRKSGRAAAGLALWRVTQATGRGTRFLPGCQPIARKNLYAVLEGVISPSGHFTTQPASSAA